MTQSNDGLEKIANGTITSEQEIELIDVFQIIWKWKYFVLTGTFICALAVLVIDHYRRPVFQVSMVLKSGINKVDVNGNPVFADSVDEFKSIVEAELLYKVAEYSKNRNKSIVPSAGEYKLINGSKTNTLFIYSEATDKEGGIEDIKYLSKLLIERFDKRLEQIKDEYDYKLMIAKKQLMFSLDEEKFITSKLNEIQKSIDKYTQENGNSPESLGSYSQNHTGLLNYSSIVENIFNLKRKQAQVNWQIDFYTKEITDLEKEKLGRQAVIVTQPPVASHHPIRPKKMRDAILAALIGILSMVFLSLFLENIFKIKKQEVS